MDPTAKNNVVHIIRSARVRKVMSTTSIRLWRTHFTQLENQEGVGIPKQKEKKVLEKLGVGRNFIAQEE